MPRPCRSRWPASSLIGLINGFLVAYADVPAIFVTLATGSFVFGFVRSQLITQDAMPVPNGHWVEHARHHSLRRHPHRGVHLRRLRLR